MHQKPDAKIDSRNLTVISGASSFFHNVYDRKFLAPNINIAESDTDDEW